MLMRKCSAASARGGDQLFLIWPELVTKQTKNCLAVNIVWFGWHSGLGQTSLCLFPQCSPLPSPCLLYWRCSLQHNEYIDVDCFPHCSPHCSPHVRTNPLSMAIVWSTVMNAVLITYSTLYDICITDFIIVINFKRPCLIQGSSPYSLNK